MIYLHVSSVSDTVAVAAVDLAAGITVNSTTVPMRATAEEASEADMIIAKASAEEMQLSTTEEEAAVAVLLVSIRLYRHRHSQIITSPVRRHRRLKCTILAVLMIGLTRESLKRN